VFGPLEDWYFGFESRSSHGYVSAFLCIVLFSVGVNFAMS